MASLDFSSVFDDDEDEEQQQQSTPASAPSSVSKFDDVFTDEEEPVLVEKQYFEKKKPVWRIKYSDYSAKNGMHYPGGINLKHYRYKYSLNIILKEVRS